MIIILCKKKHNAVSCYIKIWNSQFKDLIFLKIKKIELFIQYTWSYEFSNVEENHSVKLNRIAVVKEASVSTDVVGRKSRVHKISLITFWGGINMNKNVRNIIFGTEFTSTQNSFHKMLGGFCYIVSLANIDIYGEKKKKKIQIVFNISLNLKLVLFHIPMSIRGVTRGIISLFLFQ